MKFTFSPFECAKNFSFVKLTRVNDFVCVDLMDRDGVHLATLLEISKEGIRRCKDLPNTVGISVENNKTARVSFAPGTEEEL